MLEVLTGAALFTAIVTTLVLVILFARRLLAPRGDVKIVVNETRTVEAAAGAKLLSALNADGVLLPSGCGGRGTCGQCVVTVLAGGGPHRTRSTPERALLAAIAAAGLPAPETNLPIGRWEVDFLWRAERLVVEVDAYSTHSSPRAFERDRRKDAELRGRGLTVQRFTAERIREDLASVLSWIEARLGLPAAS